MAAARHGRPRGRTLYTAVAPLTHTDSAGSVKLRFRGRAGGRSLIPRS